MHISIIYLVITTLIYASLINSQPYRGAGLPMDDLVAAIATAAINGAIPFNKINLRDPKANREPLRIPILLIKHNDLMARGIKLNPKFSNDRHNWNMKNGRGFQPNKNRNFNKEEFLPKPRFPTHGMKVVPAPKLFQGQDRGRDRDIPVPKKNYDRPPLKVEAERYQNREPIELPERYPERPNERLPERPIERLPERPIERLPERLPEKEHESELGGEPERPPLTEQVDYDERPDNSPPLKPVIRTPTIIRHVYGSQSHLSSSKPTIPPRYLKDMPIIKSSDSDDKYKNQLQSLPPIDEILPPIKDDSDNYKTEPIVNHKYVNIGDVYRKANSEEEVNQDEDNVNDDTLGGYAKNNYDKQLVSTLKNLMSSSKERHPLNIGGLGETDVSTGDNYKTNTKTLKTSESYFSSTGSYSSQPLTYSSNSRQPQTYETIRTTSQQNQQLIPQSLLQYSSQSQSLSQSKMPGSLLAPVSSYSGSKAAFSSTSAQSLVDKYLSPPSEVGVTNTVQLLPGQVPVLPDLSTNRKPVSINLDYNTASRPLSPSSFFDQQSEQKLGGYGQGQVFSVNSERVIPKQVTSSYQTAQQPVKTYVMSGMYTKQISRDQDNVEQLELYDDKVPQNSEIKESFANVFDALKYPSEESTARPVYLQLGQNLFFEVKPKGNLINTETRNNRPPQKVSKNLIAKAQQLNDDKVEETIVVDDNDSNDNNNSTIAKVTDFSCENRSQGYYADVQNNCQVYYQCYLGGSYKFSCPNGTQFDEQRLLCDWPENVLCSDKQESSNE